MQKATKSKYLKQYTPLLILKVKTDPLVAIQVKKTNFKGANDIQTPLHMWI